MKRPNSTQLLVISLVVALVANIYTHYTHPAYRFYEENIKQLENDFIDYKKKVASEFIPALIEMQSNIVLYASSSIPQLSAASNEQKAATNISELVTYKELELERKISIEDYSHFSANGVRYVTMRGRHYRLGDRVMGEEIKYIDDFITKTETYVFMNDNKSYKQLQKYQPEKKVESITVKEGSAADEHRRVIAKLNTDNKS